MKAILEFNFENEYDSTQYKRATKAYETVLSLWEIDQFLRNELKYNDKLSEEEYKVLEQVRNEFYNIINNNGVNLDELMQ